MRCKEKQGMSKGCRCHESKVSGFMEARLLLKVAQKPAHGYELLDVLSKDDHSSLDPGSLYRTLRSLEDEGLVESSWDTSGGGPARRIYKLTDLGFEYLDSWAVNIRRTSQHLNDFLKDYESEFKDKRSSKNV